MFFVCASAVTVQLWSAAAGTALTGVMSFAANGGMVIANGVQSPVLETVAAQALVLKLGGAVQVSGNVAYFTEA